MTPAAAPDAGTIAPGSRVALVIGNADYHYGPKLANPIDDATDIAAALTRLGFSPVTLLKNAGLKEQGNALADFGALADEAEMAVIYFAGHGMEVDGENFLLPVDSELDHVKRLKVETVRLSDVLSHVDGARRFRLVILDACRDNPFRGRMRGLEGTRSLGRGLARVEPQGNTLVAYAARDGTQAKDGKPGEHSPYATALLKHLETPNVDVRIIFGRVRDDVLRMTDEMQAPHIYGTMGGEEVFLKHVPLAPAPVSALESSELIRELQEERDWEKAQRAHAVEAYEAFIAAWRGKGGKFLDDAARKITELREASDYDDAARARSIEAYRAFLERWPGGAKAAEARDILEQMESAAAFDSLKDLLKQSPLEATFDTGPLRDYVARFPNQPSAAKVRERLAYGEERHAAHLSERHSRAFYEQYLRNYPDGPTRAEAERLLAGGGDDRLWIEVQKTPTVALLRAYLADWPDGRHAAEAKAMLPKRERAEKTREVGKLVGGAGIGLGGLAIAGVVVFAAGSLLWAAAQSAMKYDGSLIDWARTTVAELIAPKPATPPPDPQWLKRYEDSLAGRNPLNATVSDPSPAPRPTNLGTSNLSTDSQGPSGLRVRDFFSGGNSSGLLPMTGTEALRNLSSPNSKALGESDDDFALRMAKKKLGITGGGGAPSLAAPAGAEPKN